jgi:hypothetical protein
MNDELRKKVIARKVTYLGLIIVLFFISMFWRGVFEMPFGNPNYITQRDETTGQPVMPTFADKLSRFSIKHHAEDNELRELDLGDPEIESAAFQVSLVGSRGFAITVLWRQVIQAQLRSEYQMMQFYAKLVSRLQPHFVQPWLYQAWNITYNVSVENDQLGDAYYYIASGVSLLSEGDRINTRTHRRGGDFYVVGSPDIRYWLGFYMQNKFTVADKVNTFRSLAALSCIPANDRDPKKLTVDGTTNGRVDPRKFHDFVEKYPQLVRRLRTTLKYNTREQVVEFLAVNRELPARYDLNNELLPDERAFPIFPRPDKKSQVELATYIRNVQDRPPDGIDILNASRSWFMHALAVVPPPNNKPDAVPTDYDQFRYRIPQSPALIVFRQAGGQSQRFIAQRLQDEGWFKADTAWDPDTTVDTKAKWLTYDPKPGDIVKPAKPVLAALNSLEEWRQTYDFYEDYGRRNGLNESDRIAQENEFQLTNDELGRMTVFTKTDAMYDERIRELANRNNMARKALTYYEQNRQITNYQHFLDKSNFEKSPETAEIRQLFWEAKELHEQNRIEEEIDKRIVAAARWRTHLMSETHRKFYQSDRDDKLQEETLETEVGLGRLLLKDPHVLKTLARKKLALQQLSPMMTAAAEVNLSRQVAEDEAATRIAMAIPNEDLTRQVKQTIAELIKQFPNAKPGEFETRRELVETEFKWLKTHTTPAMTALWVKPYVREQYRQTAYGAAPTGEDEEPSAALIKPTMPVPIPETKPK